MIVYFGKKTRKSGRILADALRDFEGDSINWGYQRNGDINNAQAVRLASNKRLALQTLQAAGVPTPRLFEDINQITHFPVVARPDKHHAGRQFYLCRNWTGVYHAINSGATHLMEYIENGREFRVHVVFGKSIKLAEKKGGGIVKSYKNGARYYYPHDFNHKKTLRRLAIKAVMSLGLDFGAVDIIYKDGQYYVLEVNTAPSLSSGSNTLDKYVRAFTDN